MGKTAPIFFTADTHFGHANLVAHGYRAFGSVEEMDETIIARWNAVVPRDATVWHLGDFTMQGAEIALAYKARLNGNIHLIWGNHDRNSVRAMDCWRSSEYATEISVEGIKLTLCHYAMRVWNKGHHGSLMLHGHSHGNLPGTSQSLDVGVDAWNFTPVQLPAILDRLRSLPAYQAEDHHVVPSALAAVSHTA